MKHLMRLVVFALLLTLAAVPHPVSPRMCSSCLVDGSDPALLVINPGIDDGPVVILIEPDRSF